MRPHTKGGGVAIRVAIVASLLLVFAGVVPSAGLPTPGAGTNPPTYSDWLDLLDASPPTLRHELAAGLNHTCGIRTDGGIACWGSNAAGQLDNIPSGRFTELTAGFEHTCAIRRDATVTCWGSNAANQLSSLPGAFTALAAGRSHTCGIRSDTTLACWGNNMSNQLDGVPTGAVSQLAAGLVHTCALRADATLACWGSDDSDQLDNVPSGAFSSVVAGHRHTCGIRADASVACFGSNDAHQLDNIPTGGFVQLAAGELHTCGIRIDGAIACWGDNSFGAVTGPTGSFAAITAGQVHTCAIRDDAVVVCWGTNGFGQLANIPTGGVVAVSAGANHTCGLRPAGTIRCWGNNAAGQLADVPPGTFGRAVNDPAVLRAVERLYQDLAALQSANRDLTDENDRLQERVAAFDSAPTCQMRQPRPAGLRMRVGDRRVLGGVATGPPRPITVQVRIVDTVSGKSFNGAGWWVDDTWLATKSKPNKSPSWIGFAFPFVAPGPGIYDVSCRVVSPITNGGAPGPVQTTRLTTG